MDKDAKEVGMSTALTPELQEMTGQIRGYAREFGLDPFEVIFELLDYDQMNMVVAYGGFPTRYPHWRFGMLYEEISKTYSYGLQKVYELVINNDPCYSYLLKCNHVVDQKLVMAHVYAHSDFFKCNYWFSKTNRKMMDEMANHGVRIRRYIDRHGLTKVEEFIDTCLSLENLIDTHSQFIIRKKQRTEEERESDREDAKPTRLRSKSYMEEFINPPEYIEAERQRIQQKLEEQDKFPPDPEKDLLSFLIEHAPIERWQRDILSMMREEAYYFAPQAMTKIMNEGWASYWHSKIMTEKACTAAEIVDYADHHAATMGQQPGALNPYKVGLELFRDIEERWNKGRFGPEWEECDDYAKKASWDRKLGLGRKRVFEVRKIYNDVTFIDEFLTEDFCRDHQLFTFAFNKQTNEYEIESRSFKAIKEKLLFNLSNFGQPFIYLENANYKNRGELYLIHRFEGVPLKMDAARETLGNLFKIWQRPVHLETVVEKRHKLFTHNGTKVEEKILK
ncbi:MAG: SpoVR family protein [Planctomycetes bacterium]|nr:SpoVR family protein [Planctomycetota bacterium]